MVDVSKLGAEELNELMEKCRARQAELKREIFPICKKKLRRTLDAASKLELTT